MQVKHHGVLSKPRSQPGSETQGASLGNHEFISQTNENADSVPVDDRYKVVDDLTVLETINLLNIGLTNQNIKQQIASDIPEDSYFFGKCETKISRLHRSN